MLSGPDTAATSGARAALARLADHADVLEGEVLSVLAVLGEPGPQRVVDTWLDQLADSLRAVASASVERSDELPRPRPAATSSPATSSPATSPPPGARR